MAKKEKETTPEKAEQVKKTEIKKEAEEIKDDQIMKKSDKQRSEVKIPDWAKVHADIALKLKEEIKLTKKIKPALKIKSNISESTEKPVSPPIITKKNEEPNYWGGKMG